MRPVFHALAALNTRSVQVLLGSWLNDPERSLEVRSDGQPGIPLRRKTVRTDLGIHGEFRITMVGACNVFRGDGKSKLSVL